MKLAELHDQLFEVLCLVDDICKKHNVRYFLDSGTEIGAVRDKNIIPWDDDIDLKVLREDYPAFKAAMLKELPEHYHFIEPADYAPAFFDFVPHVFDDRKPIRKETDEDRYYKNYQNRVGLDVFILDKAPESTLSRKIQKVQMILVYGLSMAKRYKAKKEKYTLAEKAVTAILSTLGKPFSMEWLCRQHDRIVTKYQNTDSKLYFYSNSINVREEQYFPAEWYEGTEYAPMRDRMFPIPSGYHEELTMIYGDYMKPPKDRSIYIQHFVEDEE